MKNALQVFSAPLAELSFVQRLTVRSILLVFAPLIKIENEDNLPSDDGPVIFVLNHNNSFETILIAAYLMYKRRGRKVRFVVDWMWGYLPVVGWFVRQVEPIYVFNKPARYKLLEVKRVISKHTPVWAQISSILEQKGSVCLFPEGTRNFDPEKLKTGRTGIGKIVMETAAPVLPIGIDYPLRIKSRRIPRIGRIIFRIGRQMDFTEEFEKAEKIKFSTELSQRHKEMILHYFNKLIVHRVMIELSGLSGKAFPFDPPSFPRFAD